MMSTERMTFTVEEARRVLGIGRSSTYQAIKDGAIPSLRIGRLVLVPRAAIERMLEQASQPRGAGEEP